MAITTVAKRSKGQRKAKEVVLSIRLDLETVGMLDELAEEMERSRSSVAARAIREYVEQEYAILSAVRDGDKDVAEGRTVSLQEARAWLKARSDGRERAPRYGQ